MGTPALELDMGETNTELTESTKWFRFPSRVVYWHCVLKGREILWLTLLVWVLSEPELETRDQKAVSHWHVV